MSNSCYKNSFLLIPSQTYYQKRGVHIKKKIFKEILGNKKVIFINNTSWQIMTSIRDVGLVKILNTYQNRDRRDGKGTCYQVWQPELICRAHMKEGKNTPISCSLTFTGIWWSLWDTPPPTNNKQNVMN